jgi:hypothetical protein
MNENESYPIAVNMLINVPLFREQRRLLWKLTAEGYGGGQVCGLLEGITSILDAIADEIHDTYGVRC